ncbi:glycosyl hydrolase family 18 protein [Pedobacter cryotolerans]|uniref:chitinase n=1 Tax=Pedobacter cryotolerans TaxID=2571270 RepID=A0A4U1CAN9_9SPHI|nr:glycoside hydrolase family 18 protein [Pedobacter cryotolerans]TKC03035.1 glycoside hydrolase family 18 protein [Pedobacter cryotolerans]
MKLRNLLYLSILVLSFSACKKSTVVPVEPPVTPPPVPPPVSTTPYTPDNSFKIIAYMPSYRDPATVADAKYKMITHLFYAFLNPSASADGSLQPLLSQSRFLAVQQKAKANNVKFGISVGITSGTTEATFAAIAASPTARANFVKNIVDFAKNNNLDGVDMDWEYPRTVSGSPNTDFTALMRELSTELHKLNKFLSAAITPAVYTSTNRDAIQADVYQYVDFFNIMQYDGAGYDTAEPLNHASMKMTDASLNMWLTTKGMPKEKAILGMPLYGKDAAGASIGYRDIEASGADITLNVATVSGKTYGYNGTTLIKAKAQKAKDRCNGIMFWEFSHDSNSANSLIKAANDQLGRSYN